MAGYDDLIPASQGATGAGAYADLIPGGGGGAAPASASGSTPAGAVTGRTQVPPPWDVGDSTTGFIMGNLNKGIAGLVGLPMDTMLNLKDLLAAGVGTVQGAFGGNMPELTNREGVPFSGAWNENMMRRGNMVTPAADPQSGAGRYAAAALQMAPGAVVGRPTNPMQGARALGAATTSGLGAEAARDIGGEEWAGVGAMLPGSAGMAHRSIGERATQARKGEQFGKAREMGIPVPPRDLKADKPQQSIQNRANADLRQPPGTEISSRTLQQYRNQFWSDYENIIKHPALAQGVQPTQRFQQEIMGIGQEIEKARASLPETFKGMRPVVKLLSEYGYAALPQGVQGTVPPRQQPIPSDVAIRAIKKLRADASANMAASDKPEKIELGKTQKKVAGALENLVEENLAKTGDQALMQKFKEARTAIAKSHDYEAAIDPRTGKIDPGRMAALQEDRPLSGGAKEISDVSRAFPSAMRGEKAEETFTRRVSPMAVTHPSAVAAHQAPRLLDRLMMNPVGQMMIDPRGYLTPEQQQMLRYLSAATASNRQGIPTPP